MVLFSALLGIGDTPQHGLSMREGPVEWMDGGLLMATWEKSEDGGLREMRGGGLSELKRAELHEDLGGYWAPVQSSGAARLPVRSNEEMKWGGWE